MTATFPAASKAKKKQRSSVAVPALDISKLDINGRFKVAEGICLQQINLKLAGVEKKLPVPTGITLVDLIKRFYAFGRDAGKDLLEMSEELDSFPLKKADGTPFSSNDKKIAQTVLYVFSTEHGWLTLYSKTAKNDGGKIERSYQDRRTSNSVLATYIIPIGMYPPSKIEEMVAAYKRRFSDAEVTSACAENPVKDTTYILLRLNRFRSL